MINLPKSLVQANEPTYELHTLGWKAFQQLCTTITSEIWGQTVQGFFDSKDGGRDGAFYGRWVSKDGELYEGSFTIQCKFTAKPNQSLSLSALKDELIKAQKLSERNLCDNYFLFSNHTLLGINDEKIVAAFEAIEGIKKCRIFGVESISQFIRESPRLRLLVPRVYGLGDLSTILDERALAQSKEILSSLGDDLQKFVITEAYNRSATALVEHGFVILLGEPACGKSAIASALAIGSLDKWGCSTYKIKDAHDFSKHSNPHDAKQFFWVDDVFGATQLDYQSVLAWNQVLPHVRAAMQRGAKFVFTSRDYIYRNARNFLKESALPVLSNSQVIIKVEEITKDERQQILYNHIRLGSQSQEFKAKIKNYLPDIAANKSFSPEIARRLGNPAFTTNLSITAASLTQFTEHPIDFLKEVIQTLDGASRSAIALVFMRNGSLGSPISLSADEENALSLLGGKKGEVISALEALNGSMLLLVTEAGKYWWRFKHPTIRDAFADLVAESRELMDIYLKGTPLLQMLSEITCGEINYEGVKVIVPPDRFELIQKRIMLALKKNRDVRSRIYSFLSYRADKQFLSEFLIVNPDFMEELHMGAYLYAVSDVGVIATLHKEGLLPEEERIRHVNALREIVLETPDAGFIRDNIKGILTSDEYIGLLADVKSHILFHFSKILNSWQQNEPFDGNLVDYYASLEETLEEYKSVFKQEHNVLSKIDEILSEVERRKEDSHHEDEDDDDRGHRDYSRISQLEDSQGSRSIFDDVDE